MKAVLHGLSWTALFTLLLLLLWPKPSLQVDKCSSDKPGPKPTAYVLYRHNLSYDTHTVCEYDAPKWPTVQHTMSTNLPLLYIWFGWYWGLGRSFMVCGCGFLR